MTGSSTSRYRWIVFDLDGTLFDYDRAEVQALSRTLAAYDCVFDEETHRRFGEINGRLWQAFERGEVSSVRLRVQRFEELAQSMSLDFDASAFSADYLTALGRETGLVPDAEEVSGRLAHGCRLALATNGIADVQRSRISRSSIKRYFEEVVISDEVGVAKPDRLFFSELFARIDNPAKAEVLMVGDSLSSDIAGGAAFGIDTCWFNPSGRANESDLRPTYEIRSLREIIGVVDGVVPAEGEKP